MSVGDNRLKLWDVVAQKEHSCWNSSGYSGEIGEVWYVRLLPPIPDRSDCWVTLNTPYVFREGGRRPWEEFFKRAISSADGPKSGLRDFLKQGKFLGYWLEFVFQAYFNHTGNAIFVAGVPDRPHSLPHSEGGRRL